MFSGSFRIALLAGLFGTGSWIAITGLWLELPLLIAKLPERWRLASQLNLIIQFANIGPIIYGLLHKLNLMGDIFATHLQLLIGIFSSILLTIFWQTTVYLFEEYRSIVLFICTFGMALVDCTSSITFLTFMARFDSIYMTPYLIGEGLSGFIPSIIAMLQGIGSIDDNNAGMEGVREGGGGGGGRVGGGGGEGGIVSLNNTTIANNNRQPRFSIEIFFLTLCITLSLSYFAFIILQWMKNVQKNQKISSSFDIKIEKPMTEYSFSKNKKFDKNEEIESKNIIENNIENIIQNELILSEVSTIKDNNNKESIKNHEKIIIFMKKHYFYLLVMMIWNCFTTFGFMPSIQPYSSLPYGNETLHYVVIASSLSYPIGCSFALFINTKSIQKIFLLTILGAFFCIYIVYVALNNKNAPFVETSWGWALIIFVWICFVTIVSYTKTLITIWICDYNKSKGMFWVGIATQFGGCFGASAAYVLVNHTSVL